VASEVLRIRRVLRDHSTGSEDQQDEIIARIRSAQLLCDDGETRNYSRALGRRVTEWLTRKIGDVLLGPLSFGSKRFAGHLFELFPLCNREYA
jgi:hypothetical protein